MIWLDQRTPETQPHITWPNKPVVAQAYLDQLKRGNFIDTDEVDRLGQVISQWQANKISGDQLHKIGDTLNPIVSDEVRQDVSCTMATGSACGILEALADVFKGAIIKAH